MAGATCEYVGSDQKVCGEPALHDRCPECLKSFCPKCYQVHRSEEHSVVPELNIEPDAAPVEVQPTPEPTKTSAFDPLFVDKAPDGIPPKPVEPQVEAPREPEELISEEKVGEMFSAEIGRVVSALDLLAKRGLNQSAVIALIHDAEPKIPKSTIGTVLKTLRQLPEIYGRKKPGRKAYL